MGLPDPPRARGLRGDTRKCFTCPYSTVSRRPDGCENSVGDFVLGEKSGFSQEGFVGFQIVEGEGAGEGGTEDPEFAEVIVGFDEFLDIDDAVGLDGQAGFFVGFAAGALKDGFLALEAAAGGDPEVGFWGELVVDHEEGVVLQDDGSGADAVSHKGVSGCFLWMGILGHDREGWGDVS